MKIAIKGYEVLIDDEHILNEYVWSVDNRRYPYVYFSTKTKINGVWKNLKLHRMLLKIEDPKIYVDHINGNTLDNRLENLRACSNKDNVRNQKLSVKNTSGFKGVSWHKNIKKWVAQIKVDGKNIFLGTYSTPELAYEAYCEGAKKYHGDFHNLG